MKKNTFTAQSGFTLIELLIVIAIIGILSAIIMANFVGIRERARDATRKSDLTQIQSALELYRADANDGTYPAIGSGNFFVACGSQFDGGGPGTPVYMKSVPCDPLGASAFNDGNYYYYPTAGNTAYTLYACLENANDNTENTIDPSGGPAGCEGRLYKLQNP